MPEEVCEVESECLLDNGQDAQSFGGASVQGMLKAHSEFWVTELDPSSFVKDIVLHGYRLPLLTVPDPIFRLNHVSVLSEADFISAEIERLLEAACIAEADSCPKVCSPLLVVCNARGKKRLVLDLRGVNQYLPKQKFKYEGLNLLPDMCSQGEYFFTFDLKSGYHHVDIHSDCWTYLGFSWEHYGTRRFYTFCVLPFGLSTACYVFTKLLRPSVRRWRASGLRIILYIDDGICIASSLAACKKASDSICSDLQKAGLVINVVKSHLEPMQVGIWLSFTVDLEKGVFLVPKDKILGVQDAISKVPLYGKLRVRDLASIVGQIISMSSSTWLSY